MLLTQLVFSSQTCISDNKFHTKLYDKRDSFGFHICRLPFKDSNIPRRMFYSSACAEILRICRASSSLADFIVSAKTLILRMIRQCAIKEQFKRSVESCLKKHSKALIKFQVTVNSILDRLFSQLAIFLLNHIQLPLCTDLAGATCRAGDAHSVNTPGRNKIPRVRMMLSIQLGFIQNLISSKSLSKIIEISNLSKKRQT